MWEEEKGLQNIKLLYEAQEAVVTLLNYFMIVLQLHPRLKIKWFIEKDSWLHISKY